MFEDEGYDYKRAWKIKKTIYECFEKLTRYIMANII